MDIVKINDLLIDVSSENTKLHLENQQLKKENERLKNIESSLVFIKNRAKAGMTQENINKCAIQFVNSYLKESGKNE